MNTNTNTLRKDIEAEISAQYAAAYADSFNELDAQKRFLAEKEAILTELITSYIDMIACQKAMNKVKEEISLKESK